MNKKNMTLFFILCNAFCFAQADFSVEEWAAGESKKPFVFYVTGDGGLNSFSTSVCQSICNEGYNVCALDAKTYFWNKKTPVQAAQDISKYLVGKLVNGDEKIVLAGYSFGADVLPFIVNRLPAVLKKRVTSVVLLSPSTSTDFEIHLSDMLGSTKKRSMDVIEEMNRLTVIKTSVLYGSDEKEFDKDKTGLKNFSIKMLPGSHHFDGKTKDVAQLMISCF